MGKEHGMKVFSFLAITMCLYQIGTVVYPLFSPVQHSNVHLSFALALVFLWDFIQSESKIRKAVDLILIVLSLCATGYVMVQFDTLITKIGIISQLDVIFGSILLIVCLEATRRTFGIALPIVAVVSILYTKFGYLFPGFFYHAGFEWGRLVASLTTNFTGIYGSILDISATFLVLFMIFGGLLECSGAGQFFINLAMSLGGKTRSGPAQAAVIGSGLVGSINGSAVSNVVTTGVFTIPLMKKCGYAPEVAGAIEAVASTGGMLMPPIMGVAAFVMSGITGIPYGRIALGALIPALLYYFTVGISAHLYACKSGFQPIEKDKIPNLKEVLKEGVHFLIPLFVIVFDMARGMSVTKAGFNGIMALLIVVFLKNSFKNPKYAFSREFWGFLFSGLVSGAKSAMSVAAACAVMGAMSQAIIISGLAFKIVFFIKAVSASSYWIPVLLTVGITLFFGMGVPTTASYVMVAVIGAPALVDLGFSLLSVHLFIYYYAIIANITPPVCAAVMVASRLAGSEYIKTGFTAMRLGIAGLIIPLVFLFHPELLLEGDVWPIITTTVSAFFGMFALSVFFEGYLFKATNIVERFCLLAAGILLTIPGIITDLIGFALLIFVTISQRIIRNAL